MEESKNFDTINNHEIYFNKQYGPYGGITTAWCANKNCYIQQRGEDSVLSYIREKAEAMECPAESNSCMICGVDIAPRAHVCWNCEKEIKRSKKRDDLNKEGFRRDPRSGDQNS